MVGAARRDRHRHREIEGKTGVTADRDKIEFRLFRLFKQPKLNLVTVGRDSSFPYRKRERQKEREIERERENSWWRQQGEIDEEREGDREKEK